MNHRAAARFFFKPCNYFSLSLPSYFQFDRPIAKARALLQDFDLRAHYRTDAHPRVLDDLNYTIVYNKDGHYAWRRFQIIHPLLYVELVRTLTSAEHWSYVTYRLKHLRTPRVVCASLPPAPTRKLSKNEQDIFNWAGNFTNETVRLAFRYKYMLTTDIMHCYDSLAFHHLPWALYEKDNRLYREDDPPAVGFRLQTLLQDLCSGHSHGLPQGSALMDFFAEAILLYLDNLLARRIVGLPDVRVLRYRDDYRIFANTADVAHRVMKTLVELLAEFGLAVNLSKTYFTSDVIRYAFKPDHLAWQSVHPLIFGGHQISTLKSLLLIRDFASRYPNSGSLKNALGTLYQQDVSQSGCHDDIWQIAGVLTDIMLLNPGVWPHCIAILARYIDAHKFLHAGDLIGHIRRKFADVPHTEYLDLWLQRLSIRDDPHYQYDSRLARALFHPDHRIWNSDWLDCAIDARDSDAISYLDIIDLPASLPVEEVSLFVTSHGSGD